MKNILVQWNCTISLIGYDLWMQFENGPNEPLRRSYAFNGGRDFDYNIDGLAHYGMFPGYDSGYEKSWITTYQLRPLFSGNRTIPSGMGKSISTEEQNHSVIMQNENGVYQSPVRSHAIRHGFFVWYTLCDISKTGVRLNTIKTQMKSICTLSWLLLSQNLLP